MTTPAKHTPGPFEADGPNDFGNFKVFAGKALVATVSGINHPPEEVRANACLLAASDGLLATLEEFIEAYLRHATFGLSSEEWEMVARGQAAVRKARGEKEESHA